MENNETNTYDVILKLIGSEKLEIIKYVKALTDYGLKETVNLVERYPVKIIKGVSKDEAASIKEALELRGAEIEIVASNSKLQSEIEFKSRGAEIEIVASNTTSRNQTNTQMRGAEIEIVASNTPYQEPQKVALDTNDKSQEVCTYTSAQKSNNMYNEQLEQLINAALADGVLTEKEKQILFKKAQSFGIDLDEFEMVLDAKLVELQKQQSSAPKSNKLGDVKKCPACGAMVQSYQGKCQECGYAFENTDANSSVNKLTEMIKGANGDSSKIAQIIRTFPIPSTKSDLIEFITVCYSNYTTISNQPEIKNAYRTKHKECISKAKIIFPDDKEIQATLALNDAFSWEKFFQKNKTTIIALIVFIVAIILFATRPTVKNSSRKCSAAIENAVKKNDYAKAVKLYSGFKKGKYNLSNEGKYGLIEICLQNDDILTARKIAKNGFTWSSEKEAISKIIRYYIEHNQYDDALSLTDEWPSMKVDVMKQIVTVYCENGDKKGAKRFVKLNKDRLDSEGVTVLNQYIDNY